MMPQLLQLLQGLPPNVVQRVTKKRSMVPQVLSNMMSKQNRASRNNRWDDLMNNALEQGKYIYAPPGKEPKLVDPGYSAPPEHMYNPQIAYQLMYQDRHAFEAWQNQNPWLVQPDQAPQSYEEWSPIPPSTPDAYATAGSLKQYGQQIEEERTNPDEDTTDAPVEGRSAQDL